MDGWKQERRDGSRPGRREGELGRGGKRRTGRRAGSVSYTNSNDLLHPAPCSRQDSKDVLDALLRLVGDAAFDQVAGGVGGDLAGDEDLVVGFDGLGLWGRVLVSWGVWREGIWGIVEEEG